MSGLSEFYKKELKILLKNAAMLCIIGLLLNIVPAYIAQKLGAPIWLDTIGTIFVAVIGGYLPGILIGFLTNLINAVLVDFSFIYYSVISVWIALISTYFYNKGFLYRFRTLWPLFFIFPLVATIFDRMISWVLEGELKGNFMSGLCIEFFDKGAVLCLVLLIFNLMPKRWRSALRIAFWQQKPLSRDEALKTKNMECRSVSIRTKMIMIIVGAMILVSAVSTLISAVLYHNYMVSEYSHTAQKVAYETSKLLDASRLDEYAEKNFEDQDYRQIKRDMLLIRSTTPHIEYLYVYKILDNGCKVIFDIEQPGTLPDAPGDIIPFDEGFMPYVDRLKKGEQIEPIVSNDRFGWLLTVYEPIKFRGQTVGYVGTDIRMSHILKNEVGFLIQLVFLFLGFLVLSLFLIIAFVDYSLIFPINSMALRTSEFAFSNKSEIDKNVERMKELDIHTGDEIEHLYDIFLEMMDSSRQYTSEIQAQKDRISKMQHSMIVVLADMVESRDENTGMHIHKTAEYVRIILEKMKQMGLHKDFITDKYITNVVNSAPLHDIGKIRIPDQILNKPGKLTDEEFAIMKSHAAAGGEMIEKVIKQVPDSSFLKEAKSIAAYHHEKWNGTGYPYGLAGEDIPFSARVMAVADVFDALVSKRIYKPQMPIEKAFSIIREGSGTHFDPEVVDVFFAAQEQIQSAKEMFDRITDEQEKMNGLNGAEIMS